MAEKSGKKRWRIKVAKNFLEEIMVKINGKFFYGMMLALGNEEENA